MTLHAGQESRRRLGNAKQLAELLTLPRSTIYERARAGKIPGAIRVGQRFLFDLDAVDAWLDRGGGLAPQAEAN